MLFGWLLFTVRFLGEFPIFCYLQLHFSLPAYPRIQTDREREWMSKWVVFDRGEDNEAWSNCTSTLPFSVCLKWWTNKALAVIVCELQFIFELPLLHWCKISQVDCFFRCDGDHWCSSEASHEPIADVHPSCSLYSPPSNSASFGDSFACALRWVTLAWLIVDLQLLQ